MYQDFAQAVRGGRPPSSTAAEGLADLRLIIAMLRSSEAGQAVQIVEAA
jgi:predicted dehydrogenase